MSSHTTRDDIEKLVIELVEQIARDVHGDLEERVTPGSRLVADLGFASLDFVRLIVDIEDRLQRKVGFHDLLMPNGRYVADLEVARFTEFICGRDGQGAGLAAAAPAEAAAPAAPAGAGAPHAASRVTALTLDAFRQLMPSPERWGVAAPPAPGAKLGRAVFLLSSPRSGSTLLRVILAGHPGLFVPPELHMLNYTTLARRREALDNPANRHLLSGAVRAVVQLRELSVEAAEGFLAKLEREGQGTRELYRLMQEWLGERLLVDKTPIYTFHPEILRRAEREFEGPLYIHLVRHPGGMVKSFDDAKLDQLIPFLRESSYSRREMAELVWLLTQQNIDEFFRTVPEHRRMLIRYEDLVGDTEAEVRRLCRFLGLPYVAAMANPYENRGGDRMADGLRDIAQFSGDLKFHLYNRIEPDAANRWRKYAGAEGASLSDMTAAMAGQLGYDAAPA